MPLNKLPTSGTIQEFPAATFNTMVDLARQSQRESKKFHRRQGRDHQPDSFKWKNTSGQDCPLGGLIFFDGVVEVDNAICVTGGKPNTTFRQLFGVALAPCKAGEIGDATIGPGLVRVKYTGATPANHQGWGPKPGQWEAARGFLGLTTVGVFDSELATAAIEPMSQVLVKLTASVAANATTTNYRVYAGATLGSETDAGFTTVPSARNRAPVPLHSGSWAWLAWTGSGWDLRQDHRASAAFGGSAAIISPGATGVVISPGLGFLGNAVNASMDTVARPDDHLLMWREPETDTFRFIPLKSSLRWYEARLDGALSTDDNVAAVQNAQSLETGAAATITEARNPYELNGLDEDRCLIVETPTTSPPHLLVQVVRRRPRWFLGTISGSITHDSDPVSVNTTAALDGGDHPDEAVSADNPFKLSASNGTPCLIVEDHDSEGHLLVQVHHVVKDVAVSVDWDSPELTITRQPVVVMHEGEVGEPETIVAGDAIEYVSSVDWSSPNLTKTVRTAVVFGDADNDTETIVAADTIGVVIDVDVSGTTLRQTKQNVLVLDSSAPGSPSTIDSGTECE